MKITGFYIIKDEYFTKMNDPFIKGNKKENRPHYYCFQDGKSGIYWMIPLSSKVGKYRQILEKREAEGKPCDIFHIAKLDNGRENVFVIQDMIPVSEKYIEREYTLAGKHMMLTSEQVVKQIERKARRVVGILKRGVKLMQTQPDVIRILSILQGEASEME